MPGGVPARKGRSTRWLQPHSEFWGLSTATIALLVLGLIVRLTWVAVHPVDPESDFRVYHQLATTLADHGRYGENPDTPNAYWPPGWPVVLAGLYALTGATAQLGAMLGVILECGAILIAALVASRLLRPKFAVAAVAAMCFYPSAIAYAPVLATEHLAALVFTGLVSFIAFTRPSVRTGLAAGLLTGALLLVRGEYGVVMIVVVAVWIVSGVGLRRLPAVGAMAVVGALVFVGPWTARNAATFGEFIPTSTNGGATFYIGTFAPGYTLPTVVKQRGPTSSTAPKALENEYWRLGWEEVKKDPVGWIELDLRRIYEQYGKEGTMLRWGHIADNWVSRFAILYWLAIVALALAGFVVLAMRWRGLPQAWLMIAGSVAAVSLLKLFFVVNERDRLPLTYLLIVIAALGAQRIFEKAIEERRSTRLASGRSPLSPHLSERPSAR
jgi:hypothetical protein